MVIKPAQVSTNLLASCSANIHAYFWSIAHSRGKTVDSLRIYAFDVLCVWWMNSKQEKPQCCYCVVHPRSRKILHFAITQVVGKKLIETIVINRSNAINFTAAHCSRAKNLVQCIHVTPCMAHSTVKSLIYSVDIDSEVLKQKLLCSFTAISGRGWIRKKSVPCGFINPKGAFLVTLAE